MRKLSILIFTLLAMGPSLGRALPLTPGDIIAVTGGRNVIRVDPVTGAQILIASDVAIPHSSVAVSVAIDAGGRIYVGGNARIARLDPDGSVTPLPFAIAGGNLRQLDVDADGFLLAFVGDISSPAGQQLLRIDPMSGATQLLLESNSDICGATPFPFPFPPLPLCTELLQNFDLVAFATDPSGDILLAVERKDSLTDTETGVYRLDIATGDISFLSTDPALHSLRAIDAAAGGAVVLSNTNVPSGPNNCVLNICFQVRSIDPTDGSEALLAGHGFLESSIVDLETESSGAVLALTEAFYSTQQGFVSPRLIRIDSATGVQQLLVANLGFASDLAIAPASVPEPATAWLFSIGIALLGSRARSARR